MVDNTGQYERVGGPQSQFLDRNNTDGNWGARPQAECIKGDNMVYLTEQHGTAAGLQAECIDMVNTVDHSLPAHWDPGTPAWTLGNHGTLTRQHTETLGLRPAHWDPVAPLPAHRDPGMPTCTRGPCGTLACTLRPWDSYLHAGTP